MEVLSECLVLDVVPAHAHTEAQPPGRQKIDVGCLSGHECRRALRQNQDPGSKRDSLGDASQIGEHHERVVKRVTLRIGTSELWRPTGVNGSHYVVVGENVIETQVLNSSSEFAHSNRIASKFDLGICDADFHRRQLSISAFRVPRARLSLGIPVAGTVAQFGTGIVPTDSEFEVSIPASERHTQIPWPEAMSRCVSAACLTNRSLPYGTHLAWSIPM